MSVGSVMTCVVLIVVCAANIREIIEMDKK